MPFPTLTSSASLIPSSLIIGLHKASFIFRSEENPSILLSDGLAITKAPQQQERPSGQHSTNHYIPNIQLTHFPRRVGKKPVHHREKSSESLEISAAEASTAASRCFAAAKLTGETRDQDPFACQPN